MLVIGRHQNEWIILTLGLGGPEVCRICVTETRWDKVRLGFEAPLDVVIIRGELAEKFTRDPLNPRKPPLTEALAKLRGRKTDSPSPTEAATRLPGRPTPEQAD